MLNSIACEDDSKEPSQRYTRAQHADLRAERGWSQERLAAESGLNRTYLSAVERSEQNMSIDNLYRVACGLGVDAADLLRMP